MNGFYYKGAVATTHLFQAYRVFSERKFLARGYQPPTMIPPSSHACIYLKIICYLTMSISPVHFFYCTVFVSREHVKRSIVSRIFYLSQNTYYSHPSKQTIYGWFKKILRLLCFFEESNCSPALLKLLVYSTAAVAVTFIWRVLC